jgi:anti-sigma regulatory factor (Ser/Thr protein kinase)
MMTASVTARPKARSGALIMDNPPGPNELNLNCPAEYCALHAALDTIEQACNTWKIDGSLVSRARIVVEELFSNTIKYGYEEECKKPVRLSLRPLPELTLVYEDEAPPFNPLTWTGKPDDALAPQQRPPGLAGIALVIGLSATARFERRDGANRLTMTFVQKL